MVNRADHAAAVFTDRARDPMLADSLGLGVELWADGVRANAGFGTC